MINSKIAPALPPGLQNASTRAPPMAPVFAPVAPAISDLAKTGNAAPIAPGLNSNSGGKAILASLAPAASTTAIAPTLSPAGALPTASVEEKHVKAPGFNSNNNNNSNSDSSYNNNRNTSQKFYRNGKFMSGYDIR